ncbi:TPA: NAD-dependent ubiquitin ligase, partial [Legionella pneumophila]|nr:NAD-dependent ubiquitin ligase [Legionella pneumophila]HAV0971839.1 NAD-dependent ubiquitin ligase [Legionella pneumophila]HAV0984325.1 NAD-dependent ubiquitin ligase [Legionella pneumophila]HBC0046750.1 NAD-dependent ubiquitin ligase [Legionella pneumophila]HBC0081024.1 NAD-dependent ubiquitin ligase [Legionella pneumophila]
KYVEGVELTQEGMHAIFARMGHGDITSGSIYNGVPTIDTDALNRQGFMPVLTGVGPRRDSGHWIMLIKGPGNQYFLFDPLGKTSGEGYKNTLLAQLPIASTLSVIPNNPGLNMGLCGYWVASVGLKARAELNKDNPPDLETLGRTTTEEMRNELTDNGYLKITGWLRAVADNFPAGAPQPDAKALRETTEKDLHIELPSPVPPVKDTAPKEVSTKPTAPQIAPKHSLDSKLLENDDDVLDTIKYVHKEYLGKPYPGPLKNPKAPEEGRLPPNEGPDRGPHGLAHTVRTMACAEVMIEEARKAQLRGETLGKAKNGQTLADVTPEELKKILIAQAFFVVGRDDERSGYDDVHKRNFYAEYHEKSEQAFRKYVEDNKLIGKIFKDQKEVDFYAAIILDKNHEWDASPAHILINQGHMVDLMRTKAPAEVALERTYNTLKGTVGSKGAEVVLK